LKAGLDLFAFLGDRDHRGLERLRDLLSRGEPLMTIPLQATPPTDLQGLESLGRMLVAGSAGRRGT
jgi:hypothetical protein